MAQRARTTWLPHATPGLRAVVAVLSVLALAQATPALTPEQVARRLDQLWSRPELAGATVGLLVSDCATGQALYRHNAARPLVPASNEKLAVTAAALLLLGSDYQFRTAVFAGGPVTEQGFIEGPLLVRGMADPTAGADFFDSLAAELARRGITGCRDVWVSGPVTGLPTDGPEASRTKLAQALTTAGLLSVNPQGLALQPVANSTQPKPLIEHLSEPLGRIVVNINKRSLNSWADNLWRSLAWLLVGSPDRMPAFLHRLWSDRGIAMAGVSFADGSGLSRRNRATAAFLVGLLRYMYCCSVEAPAFFGSLPVAGHDGTLARRMKNGPACQRVWAKTGTMHDITCLSGYAYTLSGRLLAFSLIMNNLTCSRQTARALADEVCHTIVQVEYSIKTARQVAPPAAAPAPTTQGP